MSEDLADQLATRQDLLDLEVRLKRVVADATNVVVSEMADLRKAIEGLRVVAPPAPRRPRY
jgi:hypothetical protein